MNIVVNLDCKDDDRYTVDEMAQLLAVHPETIRRWIRAGKVPLESWSKNISGRILINPRIFIDSIPELLVR